MNEFGRDQLMKDEFQIAWSACQFRHFILTARFL